MGRLNAVGGQLGGETEKERSGETKREKENVRTRSSAHEAPALGDLGNVGDELARTIASSVLVAESSELAEHGLLEVLNIIEARKSEYFQSETSRGSA